MEKNIKHWSNGKNREKILEAIKMRNKLIPFFAMIFLALLIVPMASAADFDNIKNYDKLTNTILITNLFNLGSDLESLTLIKNTPNCSDSCEAVKDITMYSDGALADSIRFQRILADGKRIADTSIDYNLVFADKKTATQIFESDYVCSDTDKFYTNGSAIQSCTSVPNGKMHTEYDWKEYNFSSVKAGDYMLKLTGRKAASTTVDWLLTSQGKELTEWSIWGPSGYVYDPTENAPTTDGESVTHWQGIAIKANTDTVITNISLYASHADGLNVSIWANTSNTAAICLNSSITIGDNASFMQGITDGTDYWILVSNNGANWNRWLKQDAVPISKNGTNINYTYGGGVYNPDGVATNFQTGSGLFLLNWFDVIGVTTQDIGSNVVLNSPYDNYHTASATTVFNGTATVLAPATLENLTLWTDFSGVFEISNSTTENGGNMSATTGLGDGVYTWNIQGCDSDDVCEFTNDNRTLIIGSVPPVINITYPSNNLIFTALNNTLEYTRFNISAALDACWYSLDGAANVTMEGCKNNSFVAAVGDHSFRVYVNDTAGNLGTTDTINVTIVNITKLSSISDKMIETTNASFVSGISSSTNVTGTAALNYSGARYPMSYNGSNYLYSFILPVNTQDNQTNKFQYEYNLTYNGRLQFFNSSVYNLTSYKLMFGLCNATQNVKYLNLSFKDEINLSAAHASIDTSAFVYTSGGSTPKTFNFINTTVNGAYNFCLLPNWTSVNVTANVSYSNIADGYIQRVVSLNYTNLNNVTTNKTLYMLSSGIYSTIVVQTVSQTAISGAAVSAVRTIDGVSESVGNAQTDSFGAVTFYVAPNVAHTLTVSASGYTTAVVTWTPSQSTYTVVLQTGTGDVTYNSSLQGIIYYRTPTNGPLYEGVYDFEMKSIGQLNNINACRMDLVNTSGYVIATNTTTGADVSTYCNVSYRLNLTRQNESMKNGRIMGKYYFDTGGGMTLIEADGQWYMLLNGTNVSDAGTITRFLLNFNAMGNVWGECTVNLSSDGSCPPEGTDGKAEFSKIVFFFFLLAVVLSAANFYTGFDSNNPKSSIVIILVAMFAFCGANFFTIHTGTNFRWLDQWIMFIITMMLAIRYWISINKREI